MGDGGEKKRIRRISQGSPGCVQHFPEKKRRNSKWKKEKERGLLLFLGNGAGCVAILNK